MAESMEAAQALQPRSAIAHLRAPACAGTPGVVIEEITPAIASLAARRGQLGALQQRAQEVLGMPLPAPGHVAHAQSLSIAGIAADRWFVFAPQREAALEAGLRNHFGALAVTTDQTDGRCVLRLRGAAVRRSLAKGLAIDLHPRAFGPDRAAQTLASHINVLIRQIDDTPEFHVSVFRGFAVSFTEWLIKSAAEFGVSFRPAGE